MKSYHEGTNHIYFQIVYSIVLDRRPLFYIVNLVLPCVLLMSVGIMAFCLSPESGEKIALTTTILLTMMLFQVTPYQVEKTVEK